MGPLTKKKHSSFQFSFSIVLLFILTVLCYKVTGQEECLSDDARIDCSPEDPDSSEASCKSRGCNWCPATSGGINVPTCYVPQNYGYRSVGEPITTPSGFRITLERSTNITYFGDDAQTLTLEAEYQSDYRLRIKITDGSPRFEVPLKVHEATGGNGNLLYQVVTSNDPVFSLKVIRKSSGAALFDTSLGGLTFSNQFIQFSTKLPSKLLYGIGENEQHSFQHSFDGYPVWPLFTRDQPPENNSNMYGVQPHYTVIENDGSTHAVAIVNSNAQEFVVLPTPGLLYRTIGGILDLYFFFGPTPENVVQQYTQAVGRSPLPPYWSLGFHLCKYGYWSLESMQGAQERTENALIPQDVQYGDSDIMERQLDFTLAEDRFGGLPDYIRQLKAKGMRFVPIIDPGISMGEPAGSYPPHDLGEELDVWIKKADGTPAAAQVWPENPVYFPDFSSSSTGQWWTRIMKEFVKLIPYSGIWIDMNEPVSFVTGDYYEGCNSNNLNNPPYMPQIVGGDLANKTLCPDHVDSLSTHYNTHNLYGWLQSEKTYAALLESIPGERPFILTRSTFLGSGNWAAHWLGDNYSFWSNLKTSIIGMLQFNQFGIPFVGADICGFQFNTTVQLCQRWHQLGAFYPFSRNHNGGIALQDPAVLGPVVAESARKHLEIRYTILPYLYTLFYYHMTQGNTVARALWHEFTMDKETHAVDTQFLLGQGFMVSPVVTENTTTKEIYFPDARWYSYYDGAEVDPALRGTKVTVDAPLDFLPLHVRGGIVYPTQEHALNTELARKNPIGLIVTLNDEDAAEGHLYYDDGVSIDSYTSGEYYLAKYVYADGVLEVIVENDGYPRMSTLKLQTIRLLGSKNISQANVITVDGVQELKLTSSVSGEIKLDNVNLVANQPFKITFK